MPKFDYFRGEGYKGGQTSRTSQSVKTAQPAPPPNTLQFFDINRYDAQAWSNVGEQIQNAGSVVSDVLVKLKESEHQNSADEFYLQYTQKINGLKDTINSGQATSNEYDLNDITGRTDYFKVEEEKIFSSLSQEFNREGYKRRNSLMLDRKTRPFLDSMSSVRTTLIRQIAQKSKAAWKAYQEGRATEGVDFYLNYFRALDAKDPLMMKKAKKNIDMLFESVDQEAKKRLASGQLAFDDYENTQFALKSDMQAVVAARMAFDMPEKFINAIDDKKTRTELFGQLSPQALARSMIASNRRLLSITTDENNKLAREEIHDVLLNNIIPNVLSDDWVAMEQVIKDIKEGRLLKHVKPDQRARMSLAYAQSVKAMKGRAKTTVRVEDVKNSIESRYNLGLQDPSKISDAPQIDPETVEDPIRRQRFRDMLKYSNKLLGVMTLAKTGVTEGEVRQESDKFHPTKFMDTEGIHPDSFNDIKRLWERYTAEENRYFSKKNKDLIGVVTEESGFEINYDTGAFGNIQRSIEAFKRQPFNYEKVKADALSYKSREGITWASNKNLLLSSKFDVLSAKDLNLISKTLKSDNLQTNWPLWRTALVERFGEDADLATRQLIETGILPIWGQYAHILSEGALQTHIKAMGQSANARDRMKPGVDTDFAQGVFHNKIGKAIQNDFTRKHMEDVYFRAIEHFTSTINQGTPASTAEMTNIADMMFNDFVVVKGPFEYEGSFQNSTWFAKNETQGLDEDELSYAMEIALFMMHPESGDTRNLSEALKITEFDSSDLLLQPAQFLSKHVLSRMNETELKNYQKLRQQFEDRFNDVMLGSIGEHGNTTVTIVRNGPDSLAFAVKQMPWNTTVRVGRTVQVGDQVMVNPLEFKIDDFIDFAKKVNSAPGGSIGIGGQGVLDRLWEKIFPSESSYIQNLKEEHWFIKPDYK